MVAFIAALSLLASGVVAVRAQAPLGTHGQAVVQERGDREVMEFVRFALRDRLTAGDIPDIGIAREPHSSQLYVRADLAMSRLELTADALPDIPGLDLELITLKEAKDLAARTRKRVAFVTVDKVRVGQDTATVWLGADYVAPEQPGVVKLCCCEGEARFIKQDGRWVFEKWGFDRCS